MNPLTRRLFDRLVDSANPRSLAFRFRSRRLRRILELFRPGPADFLLDVGSHGSFFQQGWPYPQRVIGLDLIPREDWKGRQGLLVIADVRALPFRSRSLLVLCNSVLEHVGPRPDQKRAAAEIERVGKKYFVQIPCKLFPIDPHYFTLPFFQLLPERCQRIILDRIGVGYVPRGDFLPLHYLTAEQLKGLFPLGKIARERFFGLTKSLYVYRHS